MKAPYKCKGEPWTKVCSSDDWTMASLDFLGGKKGISVLMWTQKTMQRNDSSDTFPPFISIEQ